MCSIIYHVTIAVKSTMPTIKYVVLDAAHQHQLCTGPSIVITGGVTLIVVAAIFLAIPLHQAERNTNVKACDPVTSSVLTDPNTRVFIAYGQSNADCCGEPGYAVRHPDSVNQYFDGRVYRMREPMLGAYCRGGCLWARVGDAIVDNAHRTGQDNVTVVFAMAAVPGAGIATLVPGTTSAGRYFEALVDQLPAATVLYQQGETDAIEKTPPAVYQSMLRAVDIAAHHRLRVGVGTRCAETPPYPPIASVQHAYGNGPNIDDLGDAFRRPDKCHLSEHGLAEAARRWAAAIANTPV